VFFKKLLFRWHCFVIQCTTGSTNTLVVSLQRNINFITRIYDELLSHHTPRKSQLIIIETHCKHQQELITLLDKVTRSLKTGATLEDNLDYAKRSKPPITLDDFFVNAANEPYSITQAKNTLLKSLVELSTEIDHKREANDRLVDYHLRKLTYILDDVSVVTKALVNIARTTRE